MKTLLSLFSLLLLLTSCCSKVALLPPSVTTTKTETIIERDTVVTIQADSTFYAAYIECVNDKPVIQTGSIKTSKKRKEITRLSIPKVELKNQVLTVNCEIEAQQLFIQWKEKYIKEQTLKIQPQYIPMPFKWYEKILLWIGMFTVLFMVGFIANYLKSKIG